MSRHPKADLYRKDREAGLTYQQIGDKYGVTAQAVANVCSKTDGDQFRGWTKRQCIYPNLRRWLNENRVNMAEFLRRLDLIPTNGMQDRYRSYFRGMTYPKKQQIDRMLAVTGLTYEKLWEVEEN